MTSGPKSTKSWNSGLTKTTVEIVSPLEATILGAVQGLTEFLPISSSGHLRIGQALLEAGLPALPFDLAVHLGTLVAVIVVFNRDIRTLLAALLPKSEHFAAGWRSASRLALACMPTAVLGVLLQTTVEEKITVGVVGVLLLVNAGILLSTRGRIERRDMSQQRSPILESWGISPFVALLLGTVQGLAVLPGISRSGITIAVALLCGIHWRSAASFSFLLSIPAILGASLLMLSDVTQLDSGALWMMGLGMLTACVVGVGCLLLLLRIIRHAQFHHFAWYCLAVGVFAIAWSGL